MAEYTAPPHPRFGLKHQANAMYDFMILPDGTTDWTQRIVTAAGDPAVKDLFFPAGVYCMSNTTIVTDDTRFLGERGTIFKPLGGPTCLTLEGDRNACEEIDFDGTAVTAPADFAASTGLVHVNAPARGTSIKACRFLSSAGKGITAQNGPVNLLVSECVFDSMVAGVEIRGAADAFAARIYSNVFSNMGRNVAGAAAIALRATAPRKQRFHHILGNTIQSTGGALEFGIVLEEGMHCIVTNNSADGVTTPIQASAELSLIVDNVPGGETLTVNANVVAPDRSTMFICQDGPANYTILLPSTTQRGGRVYTFKKAGPQRVVTIQPVSGQMIDDAENYSIRMLNEGFTIMCDGAKWWVTAVVG